ncbi:hypothetical protein B4U45_24995 [Mycobacterium persicum]|uniref:Uncharacterized protein n=1 Tax=Mycobacterium persicum TaxID=1487726 RepID=A0A8E2IU97_9MYCO|nr:hypothetical protein A4G31_23480 [Mycobacterium persicum]ORB58294.1 hypothetical protein BST40_02950 [Mycobacterium persicum]ORB91869.1 hypothetical protein B1T49_24455 [Mycobacterium persicum]ORB97233.1 hypothetical protein B1T44_25120 [Mycobacterium persicum]ORC03908.1 hypothetical protein B1T48_24405 [Mycobacterium persicum]
MIGTAVPEPDRAVCACSTTDARFVVFDGDRRGARIVAVSGVAHRGRCPRVALLPEPDFRPRSQARNAGTVIRIVANIGALWSAKCDAGGK